MNSLSTIATTISPTLALGCCSTTSRSPSWMPASIIESPFTRTSDVFEGRLHQVVVDGDEVVAVRDRRVGQARLHGGIRQAPLEEARAGLQLLVGRPVEVARLLEALHALRDPRLGRNAPERREHRIRRDHLVLGVVVLELLQVRRDRAAGFWVFNATSRHPMTERMFCKPTERTFCLSSGQRDYSRVG